MKVTIKGNPKEIAALVVGLQERQIVKVQKLLRGRQIALPVFSKQENQQQYHIDQPSKKGSLRLYVRKESVEAESQKRVQSLGAPNYTS